MKAAQRHIIGLSVAGIVLAAHACGPAPMLRAVCEKSPVSGQISLDARMGCGFGACVGCTIQTARGPRRVCKDGPVFDKEDLLWTD